MFSNDSEIKGYISSSLSSVFDDIMQGKMMPVSFAIFATILCQVRIGGLKYVIVATVFLKRWKDFAFVFQDKVSNIVGKFQLMFSN